MIKRIALLLYIAPFLVFSQDFSALWEGHFSFLNVKDITQSTNKIYAATDNVIFTYDVNTNELNQLTTINGLSGENISTIHYSETYQLLIIGYETGLIEIAFDNDENILSVVDILEKITIQPSDKKINHFNEYNGLVYISTDFGISVYDLERLEFGDTYFIGDLGSQISVKQTAIFQDFIYAACGDNSGIRKALSTNSNLIDHQEWQTLIGGNWGGVQDVSNSLYAARATNRGMYSVSSGDTFNLLLSYPNPVLDLRAIDDRLIVSTRNSVYTYDAAFNLQAQANVSVDFSTRFTSTTIIDDNIYIGTENFGILETIMSSPTVFEEIHPDGPLLNTPFALKSLPNELWVTFGDYTADLNPFPLSRRGFSHLKEEAWINTPYEDVLGATDLNNITINPSNQDQVFISSFFSGLLEVNDEIPTILYNTTNSGLESLVDPRHPNNIDIRVGPTRFDAEGKLWSLTSRVDKALKSFNPQTNQWQGYSFSNIISNALDDDLGFRDLEIDASTGIKWTGGSRSGLIAFQENGGTPLLKNIKSEDSNMPSAYVSALALDKRNQLWIGTARGVRVLFNTSNFFDEDDPRVSEIIIEEDGVAQELLFNQFITDIKVDGANNKWIGTTNSGLFYFSSTGQETIYHFTTDNSPLPSNSIQDIDIEENNGIVYVATTRGLVSFRSGSSSPNEDLESAFIYPNPVRPTFNITDQKVKIKDISENVNIKITDIEGNLVAEAQSRKNLRHQGFNLEIDGGTAYWNGKNLANNVVASGVYLVMLSDLDTFETRVLKLMVVR